MYFNIDHQVVTLATGLIPQFEFRVERQGLLPKQSLTSVLTFIESEDYLSLQDELNENDVVFVPSTLMDQVHTTSRKIIAPDPKLAYFLVHNYIANKLSEVKSRSVISESSEISSDCFIDELGVVIGNNCVIEPNAVILCGTVISDRSIVRAGAVIGANGFEFKRTSTGVLSVLHYGNTFVGSDVEIGSNTTVAKGLLPEHPTFIGNHTKIDCNTFIAHGSKIGERVLIAANVSISGSVTIDSDVWIGPGATLSNGITVGAGSSIGMGSNQFESLPSGRKVIGRPSVKGY